MDSISVRELRMSLAETKNHLETIKELAMPPSANPNQAEQVK